MENRAIVLRLKENYRPFELYFVPKVNEIGQSQMGNSVLHRCSPIRENGLIGPEIK